MATASGVEALRAQEPDSAAPPPVARDTLEADTLDADTLPPPPALPALDAVGPTGWEVGVWEWDRRDLLMLPDLSLLDLLERVPGVTPVRAAIIGQAEAPAIFGATAGAVRYVVDGFALDPLSAPTVDPSRFPLLALARVRVERRINGAVVRIETLSPSESRPHSIVEAATGDVGINLFRGTFLAPRVLGGPLALGFERLASGAGGGSNHTTGWLTWTFVRDSAGVQVSYRQGEMDRTGIGDGFLGKRRDWAVRARARRWGTSGEAYVGATTVEDDDGTIVVREGTPQLGVRLQRAFTAPVPVEARAAVRLRDHPRLPSTEGEVELRVAPFSWLEAGADAVRGWWPHGGPTGHASVHARLGTLVGFSVFGEAEVGGTPAARIMAPLDSVVVAPARAGERLGVSFDAWGLHLGAAALRIRADTVTGFGLTFDPTAPQFPGGEATGLEALASIPTGFEPLRLEAWYVGLDAPESWLYTPDHHWKAALVYHHLPLPSGNLEIYARAGHTFRGRMTTPCGSPLDCTEGVDEPGGADGRVSVGAYRATNLELTIRVVTVRAFVRWENVFHRLFQQDLPFGYPAAPGDPSRISFPGQHIVYGVKWEFWN
ncbi:MAG TPA: hypothetical protein VMM83_04840 [Longimicrobiales bacterium]|nr:hypothetical protein [Longimicrobiales bacterium]